MVGTNPTDRTSFDNRRRAERFLILVALALILAAWLAGAALASASRMPAIQQALPDAAHFTRLNGLYVGWSDSAETELLGYVALGEADGYGGPLTMAVAVSPTGEILNAVIADHKETPAWLDKVRRSDLVKSLPGKHYQDPFRLGADLDGVTGATYTARAIGEAVLNGSAAAAQVIGLPIEPPPPPQIQFGLPEIVLLALFGVGYFGHQRNFKYKKQARWGTMLVGLLVLGFIYNSPLTLGYITKLLLGYWPQWQTNLYFYFLIGGILFVYATNNKNPYCDWFCPFGAAQECMGLLGGAKKRPARRYQTHLRWLQRGLAFAAILLGIYFRSPGLSSYELFGTLFSFVGTGIQFAALGLVILASMFIARPWCDFLCPIRPVTDFIRAVREWIKDLWKTTIKRKKASPTSGSSYSSPS